MGLREAQGETDLCNPRVGKLLSACRDAQLSEGYRRMVAQSHTHVYMEMLETGANTLQESPKMRYYQVDGMAVGQHPKGLLAHCSQSYTHTCHIIGES